MKYRSFKTPKTWNTALAMGSLVLTCLVVGAGIAFANVSIDMVLILATAAVLSLPLALRLATNGLDVFDPVFVFCVTYAVLFVVRPWYMLGQGITTYAISGQFVDIASGFTKMQTAALIGALGFCVAYLAANRTDSKRIHSGPRVGSFSQTISIERIGTITFLVAGLATCLYIAALPDGIHTILAGRSQTYQDASVSVSAYLYHAPTLWIPTALMFFALWLDKKQIKHLVWSIAAASVLLIVRGPVGGRLTLVPLVLGAIIFFYLYRDRRPKWRTVLIASLIGVFVWTTIVEVRNENVRKDQGVAGTLKYLADNPDAVIKPFTQGQDAAMAQGLAAAIPLIPDTFGYTYGMSTVGDLFTRVVPRQLWPGKPISPREEITRELWPASYRSHTANPEYSILLSFYRDGGLFGVAIGMSLLGVLFALVRNWWRRNPSVLLVTMAYAIFVANVPMTIRDSPTDSVIRLAFGLLPVWVAYRYALALERQPARQTR